MDVRDLGVDLINKFFGLFGFVEVLWRLFWEIVWPQNDLKSVQNQTILIAGVNTLSQGLAKRLAKKGARLVFWDENADLLEDLSNDYEANDIETITQTVDMSKYEEVNKAAKILSDQHNLEVDILICATGNGPQLDWLEEKEDVIDKVVDTNFKSVIWLTRAFLPQFFRRRSGHVVTLSSTCGVAPTPHICEYSAAKSGVNGFMKAIEVDALARGLPEIQFTTLNPTFVQADFFKDSKFTGKLMWDRVEIDDVCDMMVTAVLTNQRSIIVPWQDSLLFSLQMILSSTRFHKVLARRWTYSTGKY